MTRNNGLLLIPLFLMIVIQDAVTGTPPAGDDVRSEFAGNGGNARKRFDWFYTKRAYPADTVRQGYLAAGLAALARYGGTTGLVWENIGPRPGTHLAHGNIAGRIPALAVHPTNPSVAYAGPADGGVWKTTDGGTAWVPLTDFLACLATGSLAIDPAHPDTVYWGTGEPYYSADAYGGAGVFMTTDGGMTWRSIGLAGEKRITDLAVDPVDGATLFAAAWGGIYRTTNRGGSWSRVLNAGYGFDVEVHPSDHAIVYAGIGDNGGAAGIYRSTDNGLTWRMLTSGLPDPASINRLKIGIARSSPATMYALFSGRSPFGGLLGMYRSTNGGSDWTPLPGVPPGLFGVNNQGWYDIQLGVSPADPELVFIGGVDLYRSTNGGADWANVSGSAVHADQHAIGFGPGVIYIGNDGGVWKSTSRGVTWDNLNAGLAATQLYSIGTDPGTPARIYAGTQDNGTQRTAGSPGWTGVIGGDGGMVAVDPLSSATVYGETQNGNIFRSLDGGMTFAFLYAAAGVWVTPLRCDPQASGILYTANTRVLRSDDRGSNWYPVSDALNGMTKIQWLAIPPGAPATIYAASNELVFRTTDGGAAWTTVSAGLPNRFVERVVVDPETPSTLYAVFSGTGTDHVYRSTDAGAAWTSISAGLPDIPAGALAVQPDEPSTLYLGTDLGLFITTNGGETWLKETGLPNAAVADIAFTPDNDLLVATHGRSMFRAAVPVTPSVTVVSPVAGVFWPLGEERSITWNTAHVTGEVRLELSRDGGQTFPDILTAGTPNDGEEQWRVSGAPSTAARVRVATLTPPFTADTSDPFIIGEALQFMLPLVIRDHGGTGDTLRAGIAYGATAGLDPAFGESELPLRPPSGRFDVRWSVPGTQGAKTDVRDVPAAAGAPVVFLGLFQEGSGGYPMSIHWSRSQLPAGMIVLRDEVTHGMLFNVALRDADSLLITNSAFHSVELVYREPDSLLLPVTGGWNMVSLPYNVADPRMEAAFPGSTSPAYGFAGESFVVRDSVTNGGGYWVRFTTPSTLVTGEAREQDSISVSAGWNFVGSIGFPVPVDSIRQFPAGIVLSPFIGQEGPATVIEPGRSYWVRIGQEGILMMRKPAEMKAVPPARQQESSFH